MEGGGRSPEKNVPSSVFKKNGKIKRLEKDAFFRFFPDKTGKKKKKRFYTKLYILYDLRQKFC